MNSVWFGRRAQDRIARALLVPGSWLYGAGWQAYLGIYRLGLKHAFEPEIPTVCIGSLAVGGSGKSPMTLFVAQCLLELGQRPIISCSGYGSPRQEGASLAPDGPLSPAEWGDEPAMMRWLMPELPIIVGRRRVEAAKIAAACKKGSILLMDDGFQHLPLKKSLSIILDETEPLNPFCLPAGPYREPRWNRRRADIVLPSSEFQIESSGLRFADEKGEPVEAPRTASVLCALGRPDRFLADLERAGVRVETQILMQDHDPLTAGNLLQSLPEDLPVVVTAKDWVKLQCRPDWGQRVWRTALQAATINPKDQWIRMLAEKLNLN